MRCSTCYAVVGSYQQGFHERSSRRQSVSFPKATADRRNEMGKDSDVPYTTMYDTLYMSYITIFDFIGNIRHSCTSDHIQNLMEILDFFSFGGQKFIFH